MLSKRLFRSLEKLNSQSKNVSKSALEWLVKEKNIGDAIAGEVISSFPAPPSLREVQQLGDKGLVSLVEAIVREKDRNIAQAEQVCADVTVNFNIPGENRFFRIVGKEGDTLCSLQQKHKVLSESLVCACNGIAACSTCHVIVDAEHYLMFPPPEEAELDLLDLAWGVQTNSRLGCQIRLSAKCDGVVFTIPEKSYNLFN